MAFLSAVFSPCYPPTNNQHSSSSNLRNQATIQDDRVTVQQVQGEGLMVRQCTQPMQRRDVAWFMEKVLLVQAHDEGKELDEEQLAYLANPRVADGQVAQTITHNAAFQNDDLDTYDFDYDNIFSAKARIKPILYDGNVLSKAYDALSMVDDEEPLILAEESQLKMVEKQNNPIMKKEKIYISPISYSELNKLAEDFGKCFVPQQELSAEQKFWLQSSDKNSEEPSNSNTPLKIEVSSELPKLQAKDTVISKLKKIILSFRENVNPAKVKKDIDEIKTINIKLEHSMAKLLSENEKLHKGKEHLEKTYKELYDSIKPSCVHAKEQCDSLIVNLNSKSMENAYLKAQIQKKVFANAASKPHATSIAPGISKLDLEPLALKILKNKDAHLEYIKHSRKHVDILQEIVKSARALCPLDSNLDSAYKYVQRIQEVVQIVLWYLDSGCSKHMTRNRSQLTNFVNKFLGTVKFGYDQIAKIMGYGDYQIGNVTISRVYYVEGLRHNLFSVGQFHDLDLKVAFRKHTCFVCNLEGVDLLIGSQRINLNTLSIGDMMKSSLICLLLKASKTKSWLWHQRLSHLNFGTIIKLAKQGLVRVLEVAAPVPAISTSTSSSISVDQDVQSPSTSQIPQESPSHVIPLGAEEVDHDIKVVILNNVHSVNQPPKHISKWTKDHLIDNNAFLNDILREEVYVSQPDGFVDPENPNHMYKLKKALYGLKKAPRGWYDLLLSFLLSQKFSKGTVDHTLFIRREANYILLISQSPRGIFHNQSKFALEIIKKYSMETGNPVDTPMVEKSKLDADPQGKEVEHTHYRKMIGSLMYLTANETDLQFVVCMCARFMYCTTAFADADYAGCQDTKRSTSGSMLLLGDRLVSWSSRK
uniref:Retrotransposon protein, putative, unclassified n=1 Tax=Tanacetum cinerariifolium TaxID=118510 RepID=A0A6L2KCX2_TANCI|nr:retrotransposon protein, putative, unclassified [Tanacetum cinerariifolium]